MLITFCLTMLFFESCIRQSLLKQKCNIRQINIF